MPLPGGGQRFDLDFQKFDAHRRHTASWAARVEVDAATALMVPCMELMRFYFGASGSLSAQLLSGARAHGGLYLDWHRSAVTGVANLTLGEDLNGAAAATVARIASDKAASRAFWDVVKSGMADHANRKPWYPRMRFPLVGRTDLTCEGEWLDHKAYRVFVVYRILQCTHPFAFSKLFFRLSDSSSASGTKTNNQSLADSPPDATKSTEVKSEGPATASGQPRNDRLRPVEMDSPKPELDPFPDLALKSVVRVSRPSPGGAAPPLREEAAGQAPSYAPMGSSGGDLRGMDISSGSAEVREREPKLLTQLTLEVVTEIGTGGRIRSPLGGVAPLRVSTVDSTSLSETPVWVFLACLEVATARGSTEHRVAVTFRDSYFDGPGYEVHIFKVSRDMQWTAEACDTLAGFEVRGAESLDPLPGVEYIEGGSGQASQSLAALESLARAVAAHVKEMRAR